MIWLKDVYYQDSLQKCELCKPEIAKAYYVLKEPKDSIFQKLNTSISFDGATGCHYIYNSKFPMVKKEDALDFSQWQQIKKRCDSVFALIDSPLLSTIVKMRESDQLYRKQIKKGADNTLIWSKQLYIDSINRLKIDSIFNQYNVYPGKDMLGYDNRNIFFIVIQHAPLETQEKYLPFLQQAVEKKQLDKSNLCYLIDRILSSKDLPQKYGTQLVLNKEKGKYELYKVENLKDIDKVRADMGLGPLKEYLKKNGVDYSND
jgi:hypothetical protein